MPQLRGTDGEPRTTLEKFTVDLWVKFLDLNGEHPIFMEDGWTPGAMHIHDRNATILHLLGIDHRRLTYRYQGRDFRLTDIHGHVLKDILS